MPVLGLLEGLCAPVRRYYVGPVRAPVGRRLSRAYIGLVFVRVWGVS